MEIKFLEVGPQNSGKPEVVVCDTISLIENEDVEAFCGNLSLDITYEGLVDNGVSFSLRYIPLPPSSTPYMDKVVSPLDIPYLADSVLVKGENVYRALFTPLSVDSLETDCNYNHTNEDQFMFDPSANFDIYFVQNSLGDYFWNNIRDHLEYELEQFNKFFNFTQPGKINFYLYPCNSPFYVRYRSTDYGIHPAKNNIYFEYSHKTVGIPVEGVNLLKLFRYWGYSPRLLTDGAAGITDFYKYYCRYYKKTEGLYPLKDMLKSVDYDNLPDVHKRRMEAASFVGYLSGTVALDKFRELYVKSTDLTLRENLEELTGKKLPQLESEWETYIDTVSFPAGLYHYYAQRALTQRRLSEAIYLYEQGLKVESDDSTMLVNVYNVYYLAGNYKKAAETIRKMSKFVPKKNYYIPLANMLLADSYIDSAMYYYQQARDLEPKNEVPIYKLGQVEYFLGHYNTSRDYFLKLLDSAESIPLKIDAYLYLGRIYKHEGKADVADSQFTLALNASKNLLARFPDNPLYNLRAGEAALYLGEPKAGREFLKVAEFVELRPFYLSRTLLAIGKTYDAENDRKEAVTYYDRVLAIPSPYIEKYDAEKLIKQPFKS